MDDDGYNVIGIDLGTTNSCAAVWKNGQIEVVPNEMGRRTTPSVVSFLPNETLIGFSASNKRTSNYVNTVFDCKRLIGHKINEEEIQSDINSWPYKVVGDERKNPIIQIEKSSSGKVRFTPEDISGMILNYLRVQAENFCGRKISDAVITVPAYFNDEQRRATEKAARYAKLNVLRLLDEPSAAAFAYNFEQGAETKRILIYDLGGGTFDVSLLEVGKQRVHVIASVGNNHLGGEDFTRHLIQHLFYQYKLQKGEDVSNDSLWKARMYRAVESCKVDLSATSSSLIEFENTDFTYSVSRFLFENLNKDLFTKTLDIVKETLQRAGLTPDDVDEVVLVGGSTRIPRIQQMLQETFPNSKMSKNVNPDEAVAMGAVIMASVVQCQRIRTLPQYTSIGLGIETHGGLVEMIIPRGSPLPAEQTISYTIPTDYQERIEFCIVMGERRLVDHNILLGTIVINDLPLCRADAMNIVIVMLMTESHLLHVTVNINQGQRHVDWQIALDTSNPKSPLLMKQEVLDEMLSEAQEMQHEDEEIVRRRQSMNVLDCLLEDGFALLHTPEPEMTVEWIEQMRGMLNQTKEWMKKNPDADCASCESHEQLIRKRLYSYRNQLYICFFS